MKVINLFLILSASILVLSCRCTPQDPTEKYLSELTQEDTTIVISLAETSMERLKDGDIDLAAQLFSGESTEIHTRLSNIKVMEYSVKGYEFQTPDTNPIRFRIKFGENPDTQNDLMMGFALNAIKTDNGWKLTLLNK